MMLMVKELLPTLVNLQYIKNIKEVMVLKH